MEYVFSTIQKSLMLSYAPKLHLFDQKYSYNLK